MGVRNILVQSHSGRAGNVKLRDIMPPPLVIWGSCLHSTSEERFLFIMKSERKAFKCNSVSQRSQDKVWSSTEHHPGNAVSGTQMTGLDSFHSNESQWTAFRSCAHTVRSTSTRDYARNLKIATHLLEWLRTGSLHPGVVCIHYQRVVDTTSFSEGV